MRNPKKVSYLLSSYRAGGGEKQLIDLANHSVAEGHAVDLLVLKPVGPYSSLVLPGVRTISLDRGRMALSLLPLMAYMRRECPAVLMATDEYTSLLALTARMVTRCPVRISLRIGNILSELFRRYDSKKKIMPFLIRRLYRRADSIIANSQGVADDVAAVCGVPRERIEVIFNPKDTAAIVGAAGDPVAHPWLAKGRPDPVVAWFGRLREQKNLPMLLRAFSLLQAAVPSRLVIVGSGREGERLKSLAIELGISERVHFEEYKENPYSWIAKADVYVLSSLWEGLPNALIEALVCGVPSVAADCDSGPREILAPDTDYKKRLSSGVEYAQYGVLVAVNDDAALAEALVRLLSDTGLRRTYAEASRKRSADFDSRDIMDAYARAMGV